MNSQTLIINFSDFSNTLLSIGTTVFRLLINIFISISIIIYGITNKYMIVVIVIGTVILDYYDGVFFKKTSLNKINYWRVKRRILDSTVDRFIIHMGCISLIFADSGFLPFYIAILFREVMISGYCAKKFCDGYLIYPDSIAKIASAFIALIVISYILMPLNTWVLTIIMLYLSIGSLISYRQRFNKYYNKQKIASKQDELFEVN